MSVVAADPLLAFLGYGPAAPRVVFLGAEESDGSGGAAALAVRRSQFRSREDAREATEKLAAGDAAFKNPYAADGHPVEQWNTAARLRLALADWRHHRNWGRYWREHLGRFDGDTFLMECFPIPRKGLSTKIVGYSPRRAWAERVAHLRAFALETRPAYVIAYGNDASERVNEIFPVVESAHGGRRAVWHPVEGVKRGSIAKMASGGVVARVAFFGNGGFKLDETEALRASMWSLGAGQCALGHSWAGASLTGNQN